MFVNDEERRRAGLMTRPIDSRQAFGYFGLMIGSLPAWPYSAGWGYYPSGGLGLVVLILLILLLLGKL